jgi:hypothetical protein
MNDVKMLDDEPPPKPSRHRYPWTQMEVGQSFIVPDGMENSVRSSVCVRERKFPQRYVVAKASDGTLRCWRVK